MGTGKFNVVGNPTMDKHPIQEIVRNTPQSLHATEIGDKSRPNRLLSKYADF